MRRYYVDVYMSTLMYLRVRFLAFSEIPKLLETHGHKKFNLKLNHKMKMFRIMVFLVRPRN